MASSEVINFALLEPLVYAGYDIKGGGGGNFSLIFRQCITSAQSDIGIPRHAPFRIYFLYKILPQPFSALF